MAGLPADAVGRLGTSRLRTCLPAEAARAVRWGISTRGHNDGVVTSDGRESRSRRMLSRAIDKAVAIPSSSVQDILKRLRRRFPDASDAALQKQLDNWYIGLATAAGGAVGGAAAAPGVGVPAGLAAALAETGGFVVLTATYVFAVAELNGVEVTDLDRRKALLLAALTGPSSSRVIERVAARSGKYWGRILAEAVPLETINRINKVLGPWFVTRYGPRMGIVVLGEVIPFGVGAGIGMAFNAAFAWGVVRTMRTAFAPPNTQRRRTIGGTAARLRASQLVNRRSVRARRVPDKVHPGSGRPTRPVGAARHGPAGPPALG